MKFSQMMAGLSFALVLATGNVFAGDVVVKDTHLCCGACVRDVAKALTDVDGVTDAKCDRDAGSISFAATDEKAAKIGLRALAKAGFHGTATHDDKKIGYPKSGLKKGAKGDSLTLNGVHLCCGGCVKAADSAVKEAAKDATVEVDKEARTVKVTGKDLDFNAIVASLNKAGLHGTVKKPKKTE